MPRALVEGGPASMTNDALLPTASAPPPEPPGLPPAGQGPASWSAGGPYSSTPPTQPFGSGGSSGSGAGYPPDFGDTDPDPFGSRRVVLIIAGIVVLVVGIAAAVFFAIRPNGGATSSTPDPQASSSPAQSSTPSPSASPSQSASPSPGGGDLPTATAIPANVAVVPMRPDG